jgi:hypothetical protein
LRQHRQAGAGIDADPPDVWHQEVAAPGQADGYDGVASDYFLVRATRFDPRGALTDDELAAEHITGMRWRRHEDIAGYSGTDLSGVSATRTKDTRLAEHIGGIVRWCGDQSRLLASCPSLARCGWRRARLGCVKSGCSAA